MIRVIITRTDMAEWTGEHERPSAAYARALVQAYPEPTYEPRALREQWLSAVKLWKEGSYTRVVASDASQSIHVTIERV